MCTISHSFNCFWDTPVAKWLLYNKKTCSMNVPAGYIRVRFLKSGLRLELCFLEKCRIFLVCRTQFIVIFLSPSNFCLFSLNDFFYDVLCLQKYLLEVSLNLKVFFFKKTDFEIKCSAVNKQDEQKELESFDLDCHWV